MSECFNVIGNPEQLSGMRELQIEGLSFWVMQQVTPEELELHREAGRLTGYEVTEIEKPGEPYTGKGGGVVREGFVGISIGRPESQRDHQLYWDRYRELKAARKVDTA